MKYPRQSGNFHFEENPISKTVQGVAFIMHQAMLLMKFLQTEAQIKDKVLNYYDLYYTIILNVSGGGEK